MEQEILFSIAKSGFRLVKRNATFVEILDFELCTRMVTCSIT